MSTPSFLQKKNLSVTGIIFTILVTAGFIWAAAQWYHRNDKPAALTVPQIQSNELHAFSNLQLIGQAQKKYKETDWDKNGKKQYAKYFVHLWTSVSTNGEPILVNLIPKKVGFAMEASRAIDGYYFIDVHDRILPENKGLQRLDYEREWAIMAVPANHGQTGTLNFLIDNSGSVFVNPAKFVPPQYPDNPLSNGWTKLENTQHLRDFQNKVIYPVPSENSP